VKHFQEARDFRGLELKIYRHRPNLVLACQIPDDFQVLNSAGPQSRYDGDYAILPIPEMTAIHSVRERNWADLYEEACGEIHIPDKECPSCGTVFSLRRRACHGPLVMP